MAFGTLVLSSALPGLTGCASSPSGAAGGSALSAEGAGQAAFELHDTDLLIVGGSLAGSNAALRAYKEGKDVVVVEKGPFHFGGACGYNWYVLHSSGLAGDVSPISPKACVPLAATTVGSALLPQNSILLRARWSIIPSLTLKEALN